MSGSRPTSVAVLGAFNAELDLFHKGLLSASPNRVVGNTWKTPHFFVSSSLSK